MQIFISAARYYEYLKVQTNQEAASRLIRAELDLEFYLLKLKTDLETLNRQLENLVKSMDPPDDASEEEDY